MECACNGNGRSCGYKAIYDEHYQTNLHNNACLVAHNAQGITNDFDNREDWGDSGKGCGWVYTCGHPYNDTDENGNSKHTHDKDGNKCAGHWQCNCERYSITDTVYVCAGHLVPSTTTIQRLSYEGLAQGDGFKTTYWLTEDDIIGENLTMEITNDIFGLYRVFSSMDDAVLELRN